MQATNDLRKRPISARAHCPACSRPMRVRAITSSREQGEQVHFGCDLCGLEEIESAAYSIYFS